jgi:hypothetical protein
VGSDRQNYTTYKSGCQAFSQKKILSKIGIKGGKPPHFLD